MLELMKNEANITSTENGAVAYRTSGSYCLDLFFGAGGMRNADEDTIAAHVLRAYAEDPEAAMKIIFFARDIRSGLGERRFFRTAVKTLAENHPEAVVRNISNFAEYGRYDDLCTLIDTPCENAAFAEIKARLDEDISAYNCGGKVSLLAKWLPSVNASSAQTRYSGKKLAKYLGMTDKDYRVTLAQLRKYTDIIENRLRVGDYTFDYAKQPSCAMMKYRKAFIRNDGERYKKYIAKVIKGEAKMNVSALYPYDIVRRCFAALTAGERASLEAAWRSLPDFGNGSDNGNAIAVIDGSGSMTWGAAVRPIDAALSLGIYFAEHNKGAFANHFITFSRSPRLVEIKGKDIAEKVRFCNTFNEVADTNLEAVFELILRTAVKNRVKRSEMPDRIYIISDMEFNACVVGGNSMTIFAAMKKRYARYGYRLPDVVFWNVNARNSHLPVTMSETGAALVSGFTPAVFDMIMSGEISPEKVMHSIIYGERYAKVS